MKIVIKNCSNNKHIETISFENLDNIDETSKIPSSTKGHLEAKIFAINESISADKLSKIKKFDKLQTNPFCIYSN